MVLVKEMKLLELKTHKTHALEFIGTMTSSVSSIKEKGTK